MMSHAAVARAHLDVLDVRRVLLETALPRDDAVAAAVEGRAGDRRRGTETAAQLVATRVGTATEQARDGGCIDVAEGTCERDHAPHLGRETTRQLTRVDAAETPADDAHRTLVALAELAEALAERVHRRACGAEITAE